MVAYIRSDLEFILEQIKIAEAHASGQPLYGPGGLIPSYNLAWGLRTVDGSYNNLLPGQELWGSAGQAFPTYVDPTFRTVMVDPDGPGGAPPMAIAYTPGADADGPGTHAGPGDVIDPYVRLISNLIVDQTLNNPAAIIESLRRNGVEGDHIDIAAEIKLAYEPLKSYFKAVDDAADAAAEARAAAEVANAAEGSPLDVAADAAEAALLTAQAELAAARAVDPDGDGPGASLDALLEQYGIELSGANILLPAIAPDEGLSAPFNSWFTLFGQFFDHGLDLVNKGDSGTVMIPLMPDDPLYSTEPGALNFMVLTRATVQPGADGLLGTADDVRPVNTTTSFVDQNQTYTSHPSHQVFVREYTLVDGKPVATGKLMEGANGGMATWGELKSYAQQFLGIQLTDQDVGKVPLLRTDAYGNFIPGPNGFPQIITGIGADGIPNTADDIVIEGDPTANGGEGVSLATAIRTTMAFLADIAHNAVPGGLADGDLEVGLANPGNVPGVYDDELLDAHFIAGDGRVNENIGLTAVHHVFHSEHNRLVQHTKDVALADAQQMLLDGATPAEAVAFLNEWLAVDVAAVPTTPAQIAALSWDGERLFQAAKFGTEMQYQHLVFEEFARKIQPNINVFLVPDGYDATINPSIMAEFAHVVYRFGHSMLTETIDRFDAGFNADHISLIQGFLNPVEFNAAGALDDGIGAGDIIRGMTRQEGMQIDEFVTSALRNNLLGLPLDLATINLARGRDTGVPTLNAARREFYDITDQAAELKPYESWVDFAANLKNEASIINFIAAYGTHTLITSRTTAEGRRDAALTIIMGESFGGLEVPADATDFLNATGAYAGGSLGGLEDVDLWIGGLAERTMPFGGMLGSTFNFVFEVQMEALQNGDRFYYLQRLDGLHLFGEMEANSFAAMIMRNTNATHLPSDVFSTPAFILEVDQTRQFNDLDGDGVMEHADPDSGSLLNKLIVRDDPATAGLDTNYLRYTGADHVVMGGTEGNDRIQASIGDDTLYGDGGNDYLDGGFGNDIINGGAGNDIIRDIGGDDNIKGGDGHDAIHAGPGLDLVLGGKGNDFVVLGTDMGSEVFGGEGNDFILGNKNAERILGNEGDDWLETGTFDGAPGDNFDEIFARDEIDGNDVFLGDGGFDEFIGEGGDDIMVGSLGRGKMAGMSGFDWVTYKDNGQGVNADLSIPIIFDEAPTLPPNAALDEFESMEGLSGSKYNDILKGSNDVAADRAPTALGGTSGFQGSVLDAETIALIAGLQGVLGAGVTSFDAGDIILGGDGSDRIQGNGGDDIIDGDKWLDVGIGVYALADVNHTGTPIKVVKSMKDLSADIFSGAISPSQLKIVREIKTDTTAGDVDIAMFRGARGEYAFSATNDGQVIVTHAVENAVDGSDRLRNMEKVEFATGNALNIIVGTPAADTLNGTAEDDLILGLDGIDTLNGGAGDDILVGGPNGGSTGGTYADNFNTPALNNSTGTTSWTATPWVETNDGTGGSNQIRIDDGNNVLRFYGGATMNGAEITREVNLSSATTATITYDFDADNLDAGEAVRVLFAADGVNYVLLNTIDFNDTGNDFSHVVSGPFSSTAKIRFEATGISLGDENVEINDLQITYTSVETLNGGLGDDTYSFSLGDGNDVINEGVSATSGGAADKISILAPVDAITGSAVLAGLDAFDSNTATNTGDLVISYTMMNGVTPSTQVTTVAGHFTGTNAQTGVERINFNGATFAGYLLGTDDYLISRLDPANRDAGGVNLTASTANNFIVGEQGVSDEITGGSGNDLIFGGSGDNTLLGGLGDDLLIGGSGAGDDDRLDGGADLDTMIGGGGNDTYVVDDIGDVIVEALNAGTDTVETDLATFSLELLTNFENLTYTGVDAAQFVGTGNALNNVISGGDLADTLSGLLGNDTLNGGLGADILDGGDGNDTLNGGDDNDALTGGIGNDTLNGGTGADTMVGGAGNDTYVVDSAADVVNESTGLPADVDTVVSAINYVLGAGLENLTLTGAAVAGSGHSGNNVLTGNGLANELFGGGGNDTLNGDDGNDLLDGGEGNDIINGGDNNDGIVGGGGNDTIDVGTGFNTLFYNAPGFGNDIVLSFDSVGGTATTQDFIDLSALGVTAANFATRVTIEDIEDGTTDDTLITVRDASSAVIGTIRLEELEATGANGVTAADFILAQPAPAAFGAPTNAANTITGTAAANLINGLGGNDTLNGGAGDDVVNGDEGADTLNGGTGNDTLAGGAGSDTSSAADNFDTSSFANSTGGAAWASAWVEANDNGVANTGQIRIDDGNNVMRFHGGVGAAFDGAQISRSVNLDGATSATLTYSADPNGLDAGETLTVQFAADGVNFVNLQVITGDGASTNYSHNLAGPLSANAAIRFLVSGVNATNEFISVDNVAVTFVKPGLNAGVDTINGDAGDDTIVWNANASGATDGRDLVNGGTEGFAGDTFVINGNDTAETYRIYTRAEFDAVAGNTLTGIAAGTEIIITRNGTDAASIIAELAEIEEIRINGSDPSGAGGSAGDNFELIGDFSGTNLRLNTVTIQGSSGTDSVDISQLTSGHRIVFSTNGGDDYVLGNLRPQDIVDGESSAVDAQVTQEVLREAYTGGAGGLALQMALPDLFSDKLYQFDTLALRFDGADTILV